MRAPRKSQVIATQAVVRWYLEHHCRKPSDPGVVVGLADARIDLPRLVQQGDDAVARAVALVCDGLSKREAAQEIGASEFKLCRALAKFSAQARLAA
jgi:hypothetical protein